MKRERRERKGKRDERKGKGREGKVNTLYLPCIWYAREDGKRQNSGSRRKFINPLFLSSTLIPSDQTTKFPYPLLLLFPFILS